MPLLRVVDQSGVERTVEAPAGVKLMEVLRDLDFGIPAICGGMCSCATCHIYVDEGWTKLLPEPMADEQEVLRELDNGRPGSRLSCQIELDETLSGLRVIIPSGK